jgi:transposase
VGERRHELKEEEWLAMADLLPKPKSTGRPAQPARDMLNGMIWILMTGAPWRDLPERYGPWETVYRRFREWDSGVVAGAVSACATSAGASGTPRWNVYWVRETAKPPACSGTSWKCA